MSQRQGNAEPEMRECGEPFCVAVAKEEKQHRYRCGQRDPVRQEEKRCQYKRQRAGDGEEPDAASGQREESIAPTAEHEPKPRHLGGAPAAHVGLVGLNRDSAVLGQPVAVGEVDRVRKANRKATTAAKRANGGSSAKKTKSKRARAEETEVQAKPAKPKNRSRKAEASNGWMIHAPHTGDVVRYARVYACGPMPMPTRQA